MLGKGCNVNDTKNIPQNLVRHSLLVKLFIIYVLFQPMYFKRRYHCKIVPFFPQNANICQM
jgi:hypothetical protein